MPIKQSYDSQFFLLARKTFDSWEGGVAKLVKGKGRKYEFGEIAKIENLGDIKTTFFQIDTEGDLYSIGFKYSDVESKTMTGYSEFHRFSKWTQIEITLPSLEFQKEDATYVEKPEDIHVDLTKNYIVLMRRNGDILKIPKSQILDRDRQSFELEFSTVDLPIKEFYEEVNEVEEIGLKWMFVEDLVQFKLSSCLIQYDLMNNKEVAVLNNY